MVVPLAMKVGPVQIDGGQFGIANFDASRVTCDVEFSLDRESLLDGSGGDQIDDEFMTNEWSPAPILRDMTEHPMFNFVPLTRSRWEMADVNRQAQVRGRVPQGHFPQPTANVIRAASCAVRW